MLLICAWAQEAGSRNVEKVEKGIECGGFCSLPRKESRKLALCMPKAGLNYLPFAKVFGSLIFPNFSVDEIMRRTDKIKEMGNLALNMGRFEQAVRYYTEALNIANSVSTSGYNHRQIAAIYSNR